MHQISIPASTPRTHRIADCWIVDGSCWIWLHSLADKSNPFVRN